MTKPFRVLLNPPHMALNAEDTSTPYKMVHTETIPHSMSPAAIISLVRSAARQHSGGLKHLVFSAHGYDGFISLGRGLGEKVVMLEGGEKTGTRSNIDLFSDLRSRVGTIWVCTCALAASERGKEAAKAIASNAEAYVVAATGPYPKPVYSVDYGQIDIARQAAVVPIQPVLRPGEEWVGKLYGRKVGILISWERFAREGRRLGFRLLPAPEG